MRTIRQWLAPILVVLLALPGQSETNVVGNIISSQSAALRNAPLRSGSAVFSGDAISVGKEGSAQIAVMGGARIVVEDNSTVRLTKNEAAIDLSVERGTASFTSQQKSVLEAVVGDATIRPLQGPISGIIQIESPTAAIVVAQKGSLQIVMSRTSATTTLQEGQGARITLAPKPTASIPAAGNTAPTALPAGSGLSTTKLVVIGVAVLAASATAGILLARHEPSQSQQTLCNEVSPFKPNSH